MLHFDEVQAKGTINEFLVELFNDVLDLEQRWLKGQGVENLSITEVHMLVAIGDRENGVMSDLAKRAALTNGTVTTAVKKLESKGFVERKQDEIDRRKLRVRLTDSGRHATKIHARFHDELTNAVWFGLDEVKRTAFVEGLQEVTNYLKNIEESSHD